MDPDATTKYSSSKDVTLSPPHRARAVALNLNLDTVRTVLAFCRLVDLLQLSLTAHLSRDEAMKEVISRPVRLRREAQAQSFCRFMLTGDPTRLLFLRSLTIEHIYWKLSTTDDMLLNVIERATCLRDLRLAWCEKAWFSLDTRFVEAICALRSLTRLQIWTGDNPSDKQIAAMVLRLSSSLRTLKLPNLTANDVDYTFHNILVECQPHVQKLRIYYPSLTPASVLNNWVPFPAVRILDITIGDEQISLRHLVEIFPNLKELAIHARIFGVDTTNPSPDVVANRNASLALQSAGGGWPSLDKVGGTIGDLYTLCITCPVYRVRLGQYDLRAHDAFIDVVARVRPVLVDLDVYCSPSVPVLGIAAPSMLVYDGGAVSRMVTRVSISTTPGPSACEILAALTPFVRTSRLEYLHLAIAELFLHSDIEESVLTPPPASITHSLEVAMAAIDIEVLVTGLAICGECLRTVVLTLVTRDQSVWDIERVEGQHVVKRLDAHSGRQIIEKEERRSSR